MQSERRRFRFNSCDRSKKHFRGLARCGQDLQEQLDIRHILVNQQVTQLSGTDEDFGAFNPLALLALNVDNLPSQSGRDEH